MNLGSQGSCLKCGLPVRRFAILTVLIRIPKNVTILIVLIEHIFWHSEAYVKQNSVSCLYNCVCKKLIQSSMPLLGRLVFWGVSPVFHMPSVKGKEVQFHTVSHVRIHTVKHGQNHRQHMDVAKMHKSTFLLPETEQWWNIINFLSEKVINWEWNWGFI